jgi:hypothetical protein
MVPGIPEVFDGLVDRQVPVPVRVFECVSVRVCESVSVRVCDSVSVRV